MVTENSNKCFVCGKDLEHMHHFPQHQCHGAVIFQASGNYGSTVYDPMLSSQYLVINICDECLVERKDLVLLRTVVQVEPQNEYGTWDPMEEHL